MTSLVLCGEALGSSLFLMFGGADMLDTMPRESQGLSSTSSNFSVLANTRKPIMLLSILTILLEHSMATRPGRHFMILVYFLEFLV